METKSEIIRVRVTKSMKDDIFSLKKYGIKSQQFIRDAISEKIKAELPIISNRHKSNHNLLKVPF